MNNFNFNFIKTISNSLSLRYFSERKYQLSLRNYLLNNKKNRCVLCNYDFPFEVLETAHLKPTYLLDKLELKDENNVELMCRNCHKFYDLGYIGVFNGCIIKNKEVLKYDYNISNKYIDNYNFQNTKYFNYHFKNIFKYINE